MVDASPGLRERKKQEKLRRIETAARALFAREGFAGTTTRAIAERAGIATGTLFLYFPEKVDLLVHLFRTGVAEALRGAVADLPAGGTLADRLLHLFRDLFRFWEKDVDLSRVIVREILFLDPRRRAEVATLTLDLYDQLQALVRRAKERGEVDRRVDELQAAGAIFALYYTALASWLGGMIPAREQAELVLRQGLDLLVRGLRAT